MPHSEVVFIQCLPPYQPRLPPEGRLSEALRSSKNPFMAVRLPLAGCVGVGKSRERCWEEHPARAPAAVATTSCLPLCLQRHQHEENPWRRDMASLLRPGGRASAGTGLLTRERTCPCPERAFRCSSGERAAQSAGARREQWGRRWARALSRPLRAGLSQELSLGHTTALLPTTAIWAPDSASSLHEVESRRGERSGEIPPLLWHYFSMDQDEGPVWDTAGPAGYPGKGTWWAVPSWAVVWPLVPILIPNLKDLESAPGCRPKVGHGLPYRIKFLHWWPTPAASAVALPSAPFPEPGQKPAGAPPGNTALNSVSFLKERVWGFPGGPVVTGAFPCRRCKFDPHKTKTLHDAGSCLHAQLLSTHVTIHT